MGVRTAAVSIPNGLDEGVIVPIDLGLLFPGKYDLYFYPPPSYDESDEFWEGRFERTHRRIEVFKGGQETCVEVLLYWSASVQADAPLPTSPLRWSPTAK